MAIFPAPTKTESVETTLSFAKKPEIRAVVILQSAKPIGLKIGEINPATMAKILVDESVATCIEGVKLCKNQIAIEARKIIVNAL